MNISHIKESYDVIVVGSGPAGASAARVLNEGGLDVLIMEKEKLPRYKMCSGMIFPDSQLEIAEHFGEIPQDACCKPKFIKGVKVFPSFDTPLENAIDFPLAAVSEEKGGLQQMVNVWRKDFDYWLTESSGARVKDRCKFLDFTRAHDGTVEVECMEKSEKKTGKIRSKYLIGADGGRSSVRNAMDPNFKKTYGRVVAFEEYYQGKIDLNFEYFYGFMDRAFSELYMALTVKDDLLVFQNGIKRGSKAQPFFGRFADYLKKEYGFKPKKLVKTGGCVVNNMSAADNFIFGEGNVLLAGEAAGFLNILGEGISSALRTGRIAGAAILNSISNKTDAISPYLKLVEEEKKKTLSQHALARNQGFDVFGNS